MSLKEIIILLLGAILGNIPFIFKQAKGLWCSWQKRRWRKMMPVLDTYSWIVNYYQTHDAANSLYDCRIGNFEKKIPFFSRPEWQIPQKIDDNFHTLDFARSDDPKYPINMWRINSRTHRGHTLFEEPTLYLDRIERNEANVKLHAKKCEYYQMASNLIALEDETYLCARHKKICQPILRNRYFSDFSKVENLMLKPLSLGCTVAFLLKTETGWDFVLHTRSHATITYGGKKAVIPNFGLSVPRHYINGSELIIYNFIKEYCEELFNYKELIQISNSSRVDEEWFYSQPASKELFNYWKSGVFTLYYSGFGIDALNGTTNIALTAIINDAGAAEGLKQVWILNWEAAQNIERKKSGDSNALSDGNTLLEFIDWKDPMLETYLRENKFQSGSAFTIEKSINILQKIENGEDPVNDKI